MYLYKYIMHVYLHIINTEINMHCELFVDYMTDNYFNINSDQLTKLSAIYERHRIHRQHLFST